MLYFTAHALQRMVERGISVEWVTFVAFNTLGVLQAHGTMAHSYAYLNQFGGISSVTVIMDWTTRSVVTVWWN